LLIFRKKPDRAVQASGGEYNPELLFQVPREHPEILRLAEENPGGIQEGTAVKLMNDATALVVKVRGWEREEREVACVYLSMGDTEAMAEENGLME
jgi:hypothetical protein